MLNDWVVLHAKSFAQWFTINARNWPRLLYGAHFDQPFIRLAAINIRDMQNVYEGRAMHSEEEAFR